MFIWQTESNSKKTTVKRGKGYSDDIFRPLRNVSSFALLHIDMLLQT